MSTWSGLTRSTPGSAPQRCTAPRPGPCRVTAPCRATATPSSTFSAPAVLVHTNTAAPRPRASEAIEQGNAPRPRTATPLVELVAWKVLAENRAIAGSAEAAPPPARRAFPPPRRASPPLAADHRRTQQRRRRPNAEQLKEESGVAQRRLQARTGARRGWGCGGPARAPADWRWRRKPLRVPTSTPPRRRSETLRSAALSRRRMGQS